MNLTKALVMALLLSVCASGLYYFEQTKKQNVETAPIVFTDVQASEVDKFALIFAGITLKFVKEPVSEINSKLVWKLSRPEGARAKQEVAERIVSIASNLRILNEIPLEQQDEDQSIYGLVPPLAVLTLEGKFGKRVLSFGKEQKLSGNRYGQLQHEPRIVLLNEQQFASLSELFEEVRPRTLLNPNPENFLSVVAVDIAKRAMLSVQKLEDNSWMVKTDNSEFKADPNIVEQEIRKLLGTKAKQLHDPQTMDYRLFGLEDPSMMVNVVLKDKDEFSNDIYTLRFGRGYAILEATKEGETVRKVGKGFYAKIGDEPTIYQYDRPFYAAWMGNANHFRAREPFKYIASEELKEISIADSKATQLTYRRQGSGSWKLEDGQAQDLSPLIQALRDFSIIAYPDLNDEQKQLTGLDSPKWQVELLGGSSPIRLVVGAKINSTPRTETLGTATSAAAGAETRGPETRGTENSGPKNSGASEPSDDAPRYVEITGSDGLPLLTIVSSKVITAIAEQCKAIVKNGTFE